MPTYDSDGCVLAPAPSGGDDYSALQPLLNLEVPVKLPVYTDISGNEVVVKNGTSGTSTITVTGVGGASQMEGAAAYSQTGSRSYSRWRSNNAVWERVG